jgi:hypothetical protein
MTAGRAATTDLQGVRRGRARGQLLLGGVRLRLRDAHERDLVLVRAPRLLFYPLLLRVGARQLRLQLLDGRLHAHTKAA